MVEAVLVVIVVLSITTVPPVTRLTIARNKVAHQANREHAACRDQRRINAGADVGDCAAPVGTPGRQVAALDLVTEVRRRMTDEELRLLERRQQGLEWAEIAGEFGGTADGQRVRLARAVARSLPGTWS